MSHRPHAGHLVEQHTERPVLAVGRVCLAVGVGLAVVAVAILLTGCATTTADCQNLNAGRCTVTGTRLLTDSGITLVTPQGLSLSFSSKPNEQGTAAAFQALGGVINILGQIIKGAPVPGVRAPVMDDNGVAHSADDDRSKP